MYFWELFSVMLLLPRILHLISDKPVITDFPATGQCLFSVQGKMHQFCRQMVNVTHDRQHLQIAFFSGKVIEGTLGKMIIKSVLMFCIIKVKVPVSLL